MKASLSNVTGLPNDHRGCAEGSPEGLITSIEEYRMAPPAKKCSGKFSKNLIRLFWELAFGDSLLNQSWVSSKLGAVCVHMTWKFWRVRRWPLPLALENGSFLSFSLMFDESTDKKSDVRRGICAGSIPDSYDIYRYLNLVRYSIFDTRYFRRKCNFVYIFRGYLKRLRHKKSP